MATLYKNGSTLITDDFIEIDGEQLDPGIVWEVKVSKDGDEWRSILWGLGTLIAGLIMAFSFKWTIVGIIVILLGLFLFVMSANSISKGRVKTYVFIYFAIEKDIRNMVAKTIVLEDYNEAKKLKNIIDDLHKQHLVTQHQHQ